MKAISLLSGGLDSTLATKLIKEQGIEVVALNFKTSFCLCSGKANRGCLSHATSAAHNLGIEIKIVNITNEFLEVVKKPKYGYGSQLNPCIDCRILKFRKAKEIMQEIGASFIVTGEVLGQRPMSQHRRALAIIDKDSGLEGFVLRPLSAKLLPATLPEQRGWVSREKLLDYSGRRRKPQIELAERFGLKDYPSPSGGCLLTYAGFAKRVKDALRYGELTINEVELLKLGRHFRLSNKAKLVVARNELENERLLHLGLNEDIIFEPKELPGPTGLGRGLFDAELKILCSRIIARYTSPLKESAITIKTIPNGESVTVSVRAFDASEIKPLLI